MIFWFLFNADLLIFFLIFILTLLKHGLPNFWQRKVIIYSRSIFTTQIYTECHILIHKCNYLRNYSSYEKCLKFLHFFLFLEQWFDTLNLSLDRQNKKENNCYFFKHNFFLHRPTKKVLTYLPPKSINLGDIVFIRQMHKRQV